MEIVKCERCSLEFEQVRHNQKFCSRTCQQRTWQNDNRNKCRSSNKKYRLKKEVFCRCCDKTIPQDKRKSGLVFCSDDCRREHCLLLERDRRRRDVDEFHEHKCSIGCCLCGYSKYGGSLDYHHIDPEQKDTRIFSNHWKNQQSEIDKCVLVCKNCHHELHDLMRNDIDKYWIKIQGVK